MFTKRLKAASLNLIRNTPLCDILPSCRTPGGLFLPHDKYTTNFLNILTFSQTACGAYNFTALMFFCPSNRNKNNSLTLIFVCPRSSATLRDFFMLLPLPPDNHHLPASAFITGADVLGYSPGANQHFTVRHRHRVPLGNHVIQ